MAKRIKINKMNNLRGQIRTSMFFYIFMSIIFVTILIFGISKIFFFKDVISKQEINEVESEIKRAIDFCEDPLNEGNLERIKVKDYFSRICYLGTEPTQSDLKTIFDGGDNVVLYGRKGEIVYSFKVSNSLLKDEVKCEDVDKEIVIRCN